MTSKPRSRGGLIALTAIIGAGKTVLARRLRAELEREDKVIVSRSLSLDKARIAMPSLVAALFYDLSPEKNVAISNNSERRERDLLDLFRRAKKPVALFIDDAHDLHPKTLVALKRLIEPVTEGGGQLPVALIGHPKLKNDLSRPKMEKSATAPRCSNSAGCGTNSATTSIGCCAPRSRKPRSPRRS